MQKYLLLMAFSIATGYLLAAPDVQPKSLGGQTFIMANGDVISNSNIR